jgi:hypothetical protein
MAMETAVTKERVISRAWLRSAIAGRPLETDRGPAHWSREKGWEK